MIIMIEHSKHRGRVWFRNYPPPSPTHTNNHVELIDREAAL